MLSRRGDGSMIDVTERSLREMTDRGGRNEKPAREMTFNETVTFRRKHDQ